MSKSTDPVGLESTHKDPLNNGKTEDPYANEPSNAGIVPILSVNGRRDEENDDVEAHGASIRENANLYECAFNIFKANVASAVFLLPTFYKDAGYIMSPIIGFVIGAIVVDCSRLLVRAKTKIDRKNVVDYLNVCEFVLGKPFRYVLLVSLVLTQFGFCLLYVQLVADSMTKLVPRFSEDEKVWMTAVLALVLPVTFFSDNIAFLGIISIVATICVAFALITTFVLSLMRLNDKGVDPNTTLWGNSVPFGWFNNMANNMMMLEGIGVVLPVQAACTNKPRFTFMLTIVLYVVVLWYLFYGLTGYLAYGQNLKVSLIDEIPKGPLAIILRVAFTVNILSTYPVLFMPGVLQLDSFFGWQSRSWKGILLRIFVNLVIYALAMLAGSGAVHIVVSLIGALPAAVMLMLLPSLLSLCLEFSIEHADEPRSTWKFWRHNLFERPFTFIRGRSYIYFLLGITIMVFGTYSIFPPKSSK